MVFQKQVEMPVLMGVTINGVTASVLKLQMLQQRNGIQLLVGMGPVSSQYIYDGTVVRLRELVLGYDFNLNDSFFKSSAFRQSSRNLFLLY